MNQHYHCALTAPPSLQDHRQGVLNAAVVLVLYGDYQSVQSADVYRLLQVVQQQLRGSFGEDYLCLIFRHFPQHPIHTQAQRAAEVAEAAAAQGQFWQMHDILFSHQQELSNGYLVEYADRLGLDVCQFLQELARQVHVDRINQAVKSGLQSGVTAAPALFINSVRYIDHWNTEQLMAAVVKAGH